MISQSLKENDKLIFLNLNEHYKKINTNYKNIDWKKCIILTENTCRNIDRNGYISLQAISLMVKIQKILATNSFHKKIK